jgi:transcriptional regulator with XRE-family HTH domain
VPRKLLVVRPALPVVLQSVESGAGIITDEVCANPPKKYAPKNKIKVRFFIIIKVFLICFLRSETKSNFQFFYSFLNNLLFSRIIYASMNIGTNIKNIRELKNLTQEYVANEIELSQSTYARIESGESVPRIDKLQRIAEVLEVDLSTLLSSTNIFNFTFNKNASQSGYYINNQTNNTIDIEVFRKIIQEEIRKS